MVGVKFFGEQDRVARILGLNNDDHALMSMRNKFWLNDHISWLKKNHVHK